MGADQKLSGRGWGMTGHEDAFGSEGRKFTNLVMVRLISPVHIHVNTYRMVHVGCYSLYMLHLNKTVTLQHPTRTFRVESGACFLLLLHLVVLCARLALISSYEDASQMRWGSR